MHRSGHGEPHHLPQGHRRLLAASGRLRTFHVDARQPERQRQRHLHVGLWRRKPCVPKCTAQFTSTRRPPNASSVYTVSLHTTSTYGCADSVSHDVEVHATPIADMEVLSQEGCYPLEVTFGNQSVGGDTYTWTYGTGLNSQETAEEHTVAYFNPTSNVVTYTAVLTVSTDAGCSSQDVVYIEVLAEVEAHIEGGLRVCVRPSRWTS